MSLDTLKSKLNLINTEKDTKIIPENIKKDVTIFGVTGTLDSGSSEYNAKLRDVDSTPGSSKNLSNFITIANVPAIKSGITSLAYLFNAMNNLLEFSLPDTSVITNMNNMFRNCSKLTTVPIFDTSSVTTMGDMYRGCQMLSNQSLDNILQMCINATSFTGTKTLSYIGISSQFYTAETIQSLPHYQDFINAGWTIGY